MGNFSVVGVMVGYNDAPLMMRKFGVQSAPRSLGPKIHGALCELVRSGAIRPVVGRVIGMDEVAAALEDHEQRRTTGRTVLDLSRP